MGFLKFLKRDKDKEMDKGLDDFDVPPTPPDMKSLGDFPELPKLPEIDKDMPEIPKEHFDEPLDIPDKPVDDFQELDIPDNDFKDEPPKPSGFFKLPKFSKKEPLPELKVPEMPPIKPGKELRDIDVPNTLFGKHKHMDKIDVPLPKLKEMDNKNIKVPKFDYGIERDAMNEEKELLSSHREDKGPIFVRVDRFREVIKSVNTIKKDLKKGNTMLSRMNEIDVSCNNKFDKWKGAMIDLQKKFIFIEKTLFKR